MLGIELRRYAKFQVYIFKTDSGKNAWGEPGLCPILPIDRYQRNIVQDIEQKGSNNGLQQRHQEQDRDQSCDGLEKIIE